VGHSGAIITSTDGETWTPQTSGISSIFFGVTYGNGTFVAVGQQGTILTSEGASGIVVNNAAGLLKLNGTGTVQAARVTAASNTGKGLEVNASATIS
ncbi:uncharacterized protein METZ01_LOCUS338901, partial [marine metagenome]